MFWPVSTIFVGCCPTGVWLIGSYNVSVFSERCWLVALESQGGVLLRFRELSKMISRKYTMPEITFVMRISSWNYAQSFSLKFSQEVRFLQYTNFERKFWRAHEMLVKQPPGLQQGMVFALWYFQNIPCLNVSITFMIYKHSGRQCVEYVSNSC